MTWKQISSRWFINDFVRNSAPNLDTLQTKLLHGDNTFIDKLMYFGKVVPGSNAYWRSKKAELLGLVIILKKEEDHPTFL